MSEAAQSHLPIEAEPPELQERNLWAGARLLVSSTIFLFLPFVFAYVYLASLNTSGLWRPAHIRAPTGWGVAILAAVVVSAALVAWARIELGEGKIGRARLLGVLALVAGVAGVVLQAIEYTQLGFGPEDGGFASVFVGWTGLFAVTLLGTMIWLEIVLATAYRSGASKSDFDGIGFYLTFVAGLGALTFAFLYLL